ncbi:MAG: type II secretion system secretin GspD [Desulfobacterales bacterium]
MPKYYFTAIINLIIFVFLIIYSPVLQAQAQPTSTEGADTSGRYVSIDFNDVDIGVFIKFISELTGKNFVVDQRVRGKVTIISPGKISVDEAYKVFESVLEVNDFAAVRSGEIIKIVPSPEARTKNITTRLKAEAESPEDKIVTQLIPLKYADPEEIKRLFTPLISKNSVLLSYEPTNMLILTDVYSNIQRLMNILKVIDVTDIGRQLSVIPIAYADATKLVQLLEAVFETGPRQAKGEGMQSIKMVADERTNIIVLLAGEGETERIKNLIAMIDKETPKGSEKIRVYYLEHANAEDLAVSLQALVAGKSTAAAEPGAKETAVSGNVSITADNPTNSLIIMAEKDDYQILEDIIRQLDIPRSMVYIECLIMEVNVNKDFNLGVEWIAGNDVDDDSVYFGGFSGGATGGGDTGFNALPNTITPPPGLSLGIIDSSIEFGGIPFTIGAIVSAYRKDKDVHILSTPQILTTDNEEATITVGKNVPYKTKSGTDVSVGDAIGDVFYETFEYKDVGITLKITPQISKDRNVRLSISQEVSRLESTSAAATGFRPTTLKRTIDTTVIVQDQNTVVIGGLIDDSFSGTEYKTPCLGSVPLFGNLFTSTGKAEEKTNLYVFLKPYVIQNPEEAKNVYKGKKDQIETIREGNIKLYDKEQMKEPMIFKDDAERESGE